MVDLAKFIVPPDGNTGPAGVDMERLAWGLHCMASAVQEDGYAEFNAEAAEAVLTEIEWLRAQVQRRDELIRQHCESAAKVPRFYGKYIPEMSYQSFMETVHEIVEQSRYLYERETMEQRKAAQSSRPEPGGE